MSVEGALRLLGVDGHPLLCEGRSGGRAQAVAVTPRPS